MRPETNLDLFGDPFEPKVRNAYAGIPGSGPAGETCGSCANKRCHRPGNKRYWKCSLVAMTHGHGTDIVLKSPACEYWLSP